MTNHPEVNKQTQRVLLLRQLCPLILLYLYLITEPLEAFSPSCLVVRKKSSLTQQDVVPAAGAACSRSRNSSKGRISGFRSIPTWIHHDTRTSAINRGDWLLQAMSEDSSSTNTIAVVGVAVHSPPPITISTSIWEQLARKIINLDHHPEQMKEFVQWVTLLRVGLPSIALALSAHISYPYIAQGLAAGISDSRVFDVIAQDSSQYIQNILTTSGLVFSLLLGQTYYFMYQQQEAIYLALFQEVAMAKALLEQVALICQGRESLYQRILTCMDRYVREDLTRFNDAEPAEILSARPVDDPLEDILYLTSVGEPSIVYGTVRTLRQARAYRLGALQRKLPAIHMTLLWTLFCIVLFTFPLLGAGSQTIGGDAILKVQAWYLGFIVFGMSLTLGVVQELQRPGETGAYNAGMVLNIMVTGLQQELEQRLDGSISLTDYQGPSVDSDGYFESSLLLDNN